MEIIIKGTPEEIAARVLEIQKRQEKTIEIEISLTPLERTDVQEVIEKMMDTSKSRLHHLRVV